MLRDRNIRPRMRAPILFQVHPRSQALLATCVAISPGTDRMRKQFDWSFEYDGMRLFECEVSD